MLLPFSKEVIMKCDIHNCAPSTGYVRKKCRCETCRQWKSDARNSHTPRKTSHFCAETGAACSTQYVHHGCRCEECLRWNSEVRSDIQSKYRKNNPGVINAKTARRRANKARLSPELTAEEQDRMKELYTEARRLTDELGVPHHVDHIKPLFAGGLHHPDNLQVLTAKENLVKGAKYDEL